MISWKQEIESKTYWEASKMTSNHQPVWEARIEHDENDSWTWWVSVGDCVAEGSVPEGHGVMDSGFLLCKTLVEMVVERILKDQPELVVEDGEMPAHSIQAGDEVEMNDGWMTVDHVVVRSDRRVQLTFKEGGGYTVVSTDTIFKVRRPEK